ncbi:MAG: class I SAM-dependent methyltransferase [Anaerolineales bacterium]|nr:class I SAM-dependent methyltransferase [Anaerolineales bacterium]MCB8953687.1 class I SAM-dependent methyltransferase [Ardenticatenales bacterium]
MSTIPLYEKIAHYYDLTHAALQADIPFVRSLALAVDGPVLELGCGSGRLLLPLARAGVSITGLDNSPHMLQRARQKLAHETAVTQARVTLVEGDMTAFALPQTFSLILLSYNTLMHLPPAAAEAALRAARAHLHAAGRLFIDLPHPLTVTQTPDDHLLTLERAFTDPESGDLVLQLASSRLDQEAQTLQVTWIYDAAPAAGGVVRRLVTQIDFYYWYAHEVEMLLRRAGLRLLALYGGYRRESFSDEGERMVVIAGINASP